MLNDYKNTLILQWLGHFTWLRTWCLPVASEALSLMSYHEVVKMFPEIEGNDVSPYLRCISWNLCEPGQCLGCVCVCVCVCARARVCACTVCILSAWFITCSFLYSPAAAAVKSLQSCPTLCDPIDGSLLGSPVPGILQARTLECVAISCSNAWKWKVKVKSLSHVWLSDPMDCSLPGSSVHGIFQARVLEWGAIAFISQRWSCPWANVSSMLCSNCPLIHQLHVNKFVFLKPTSGQNLHME